MNQNYILMHKHTQHECNYMREQILMLLTYVKECEIVMMTDEKRIRYMLRRYKLQALCFNIHSIDFQYLQYYNQAQQSPYLRRKSINNSNLLKL